MEAQFKSYNKRNQFCFCHKMKKNATIEDCKKIIWKNETNIVLK